MRLRLRRRRSRTRTAVGADFDAVFAARRREADEFYAGDRAAEPLADDEQHVQRQALAGLLWSQAVLPLRRRATGSTATRRSRRRPTARRHGRNARLAHLHNADVLSMPDKWEYPWFAAWDLAFHCVPLALVDPEFAKEQLILLLRERYMHPNGQLPAYEWEFGDVNPPVHAWAALARLQDREAAHAARGDRDVPRARLPQAAPQLHLVGEPQGRGRQQRLRGRLPRARQHRRLRPQRAAARPAATSSSPTRPAGWRCTA